MSDARKLKFVGDTANLLWPHLRWGLFWFVVLWVLYHIINY